MPFHFPFNFPPFYNNYRYFNNQKYPPISRLHNNYINNNQNQKIVNNQFRNNFIDNSFSQKEEENKKDTDENSASISFFEIFGIKLYFDDILIICLLFFLYTEKVQDDELFVCLILLLLT